MIQQSPTEERAREVLAQSYVHAGNHGAADRVRNAWPYAAKPEEEVAIAAMIKFASQAAQPADADGVERVREALQEAHDAIAEYYRYWTGGETRGSYDGKPERARLWKAQQKARTSLAATPKAPATDAAGKAAVEPEGYRDELRAFISTAAPKAFERGVAAAIRALKENRRG